MKDNKSAFFTTERATVAGLDLFTVKSNALNNRADITVYKPTGKHTDIPVVILLHGVYGSHWAWSLKADVHNTLQQLIDADELPPMMLVMPSDGLFQDGSGYLPHHHADYEKWIAEDVPALIREQYEEVTPHSPFFIAGLSMGGYGALRIGAKYHRLFKAFSGLSSIVNFAELEQFVQGFDGLKNSVKSQENVLEVLQKSRNEMGSFRFDCGEDDTLFDANVALHEALEKEGIEHEFVRHAGAHSWDYWHDHISETLRFFARQV